MKSPQILQNRKEIYKIMILLEKLINIKIKKDTVRLCLTAPFLEVEMKLFCDSIPEFFIGKSFSYKFDNFTCHIGHICELTEGY